MSAALTYGSFHGRAFAFDPMGLELDAWLEYIDLWLGSDERFNDYHDGFMGSYEQTKQEMGKAGYREADAWF